MGWQAVHVEIDSRQLAQFWTEQALQDPALSVNPALHPVQTVAEVQFAQLARTQGLQLVTLLDPEVTKKYPELQTEH